MYSFTQAARNVEKHEREASAEKKRSRNVSKAVSQGGVVSWPGSFESLQAAEDFQKRTFSELAVDGVAVSIWSEVLGESILLVPDTYTPAPGDPVTYTHEEARILMDLDEEDLRVLHKVKKALAGRVRKIEEVR